MKPVSTGTLAPRSGASTVWLWPRCGRRPRRPGPPGARAPVRGRRPWGCARDAAVGLEDLDVVAPGQQPGAGQPRDAGADDGDAQRTAVRGAGEVGREGVWAGHRRVLGFGACTRTDRIWIAGPRTDPPGAASAGRGSPAWRRRPDPAMIRPAVRRVSGPMGTPHRDDPTSAPASPPGEAA